MWAQFAESEHGRELYQLHDNGFLLADSQAEMTHCQSRVYLHAKSHWEEEQPEEAKRNNGRHSNVNTSI